MTIVPKPFTPAQIRHVVEQVAEQPCDVRSGWRIWSNSCTTPCPEADLATESPKMRAVLETLARAAAARMSPVLLRGENGTGKGVLARTLHAQSPRRAHPFVVVNCPTLSEELLASELFGHAKGAFTGAIRDQPGASSRRKVAPCFWTRSARSRPGCKPSCCASCRRSSSSASVRTQTRHADVRVVAATNRDLESDVKSGRFREDLLYRLNVIELHVPPLRERPEDLLPLAHKFLCSLRAFGATANA